MKHGESDNQPVPHDARSSGLDIFFVWMGFILVVASMSLGGGLAAKMDGPEFWTALLLGNSFLAVLAFCTGYIGSSSGRSFSSLAAQVFPNQSWRIVVLYVPLVLIGWYAIESAIFGNLIADVFELNEITRRTIMFVAALFFASSAYFGIRFMGKVSYVLVPLVFFISVFAILNISPTESLVFGFDNAGVGLASGIGVVISTWVFSVLLVIPDLTRFVRNPFTGGVVAALGVLVANTLAMGIGGVAAAYTKQSDPSLILASLGFAPLAIALSFAGIWSTNDNNMYSSSIGVAKALGMSRGRVVVGLACIGALIALFNPAKISTMFSFLIFMGTSAPPLAGVVLGAYLLNSRQIQTEINVFAPWIGWLLGAVAASQIQGFFVAPAGILFGFLFWWISTQLLNSLNIGTVFVQTE